MNDQKHEDDHPNGYFLRIHIFGAYVNINPFLYKLWGQLKKKKIATQKEENHE